jgi:hypothetical protein
MVPERLPVKSFAQAGVHAGATEVVPEQVPSGVEPELSVAVTL